MARVFRFAVGCLGYPGLLLLASLLWAGTVSAQSPESWFGEPVAGGHLWVNTPEASALEWDGAPHPVYPRRTLIALAPDAQGDKELVLRLADGSEKRWSIHIEPRSFPEQRVTGVPPSTLAPAPEQQERIRQDAQKTRTARAHASRAGAGVVMPFSWPLLGRRTGVYGAQRWYNGEPGSIHWGVDIARPRGTQVLAPADGRVTLADDLFLSGNTVFLDHGQRLTSAFLHLSEVNVMPGDQVHQGDTLGRVGSTGRSTGPHLDWRMDVAGQRIDPALWVPPMDDVCDLHGTGDEAVILLHGLGRTFLSMEDLALQLREAGYTTCNQGYPSRDGTIESLATYVASAVQNARAAGHSTIHFVTHSMGGIILRYYLAYSSHSEAGRAVMLAPPNHGSEVVDALDEVPGFEVVMGPAALQLGTDDDSLPNRLPPIRVPVGVIAGDDSSDPWFGDFFDSQNDGKVSVESTRLMTMADHIVLPVGHTLMMHNRDVHAQVLHFLTEGRFKP